MSFQIGNHFNFKYFCDVLARFKQILSEQFPNLLDSRFILACSGGVDSVVLAHLCNQSKLNFAIAHCNFSLRGEESTKDEQFVRELAKQLEKEYFTQLFDAAAFAKETRQSIQMAARELRYNWFNELKNTYKISILMTAHHLDDDLETFVINLSRGTGLQGLQGMPMQTKELSRPLLSFSREEIIDFAKTNDFVWREDQSNSDTKYLRNKIRHEIVPHLKELHPSFLNNFKATQENLKQTNALQKAYLERLKKQLFEERNGIIRIPIAKLKLETPIRANLYLLFNSYGFKAWNDIERLLDGSSGKEVRSASHRLLRDRSHLLLAEIETSTIEIHQIEEHETSVNIPENLIFEEIEHIGNTSQNVLYVDKETLKYPLTIRKWEKGDYFYPLGMVGKKKLSKYFKDEKYDTISKEKQWLLCSDNQIVWVIGKRPDNRFKVTNNTKTILKVIVN